MRVVRAPRRQYPPTQTRADNNAMNFRFILSPYDSLRVVLNRIREAAAQASSQLRHGSCQTARRYVEAFAAQLLIGGTYHAFKIVRRTRRLLSLRGTFNIRPRLMSAFSCR